LTAVAPALILLRPDERLLAFWTTVSRTAFTQLRYSKTLLAGTSVVVLLVFGAPFGAFLAASSTAAVALGAGSLTAMALAYLPVIRFYGLPALWTLTLPLAASLLLAMTWSCAANYWRGVRATWKDRAYEVAD
jgi:hypothetical protein